MKSQIPPLFLLYNSRAGICRTKSTPLPEILGTRMRSLRPEWGGGGGYQAFAYCLDKIEYELELICIMDSFQRNTAIGPYHKKLQPMEVCFIHGCVGIEGNRTINIQYIVTCYSMGHRSRFITIFRYDQLFSLIL